MVVHADLGLEEVSDANEPSGFRTIVTNPEDAKMATEFKEKREGVLAEIERISVVLSTLEDEVVDDD